MQQSSCVYFGGVEKAIRLMTRGKVKLPITVTHPEKAKQWSDKNIDKPEDFASGSGKVVFWVCPEGHEYDDTIAHQTSEGRGCPYCSNHRVGYGNSLADKHPELLPEWHETKNDKSADSITPGSKYEAWWICAKGHEWQINVGQRTKENGAGCPYCSNRKLGYGNTLADLEPELSKEWHPKNEKTPSDFFPGSGSKVWWRCKKGHKWKASIVSRVKGSGCPYCSSRKLGYGNSLADKHPEIIKEWNFSKNKKGPAKYFPGSNKKVWWICEKGHEWDAVINSRTGKTKNGCPYCANKKVGYGNSLADKHPNLLKFWDWQKNPKSLRPENILPSSDNRVWWKCSKGHSFDSELNNTINNSRWCPYCSNKKVGYGNSLMEQYPDLAKEWNYVKNKGGPDSFIGTSNKKVWWICEKGHEWEAQISSRSRNGSGCVYCANLKVGYGNSLQDLYPDLVKEIDFEKSSIDPRQVVPGTDLKIWWKCQRGHSWEAPINRRVNGAGCRFCSSQTSAPEIRLYCEIKHIFPNAEARLKIEGREADISISDLKLIIEYDGKYFHQTDEKISSDQEKKKDWESKGWTLIRARETPLECSEWDVTVEPRRAGLSKNEIDSIVALIKKSKPEKRKVCDQYLSASEFLDEGNYKRVLSFLPGPPEEESLSNLFPEIAKEWNKSKNYPLEASMFHARSGRRVWWICEKGHEWEATIDKRIGHGMGCPFCKNKRVGYGNSLADMRPDIAKYWFYEGNEGLTPDEVVVGSGKSVWWKCDNGHIHKARVVAKTRKPKFGCKYCPGIGKNHAYEEPTIFGL